MIFTDKREALDNIEDYMLQYIQGKDGSQRVPDLKSMEKMMFNSIKEPCPPGHYITRSDQIDTYTIYQSLKEEETVAGKLWGAYKVEKSKLRKICTVSIVEVHSDLIRQVQKEQLSNGIPKLSELRRLHNSDSETDSDSEESPSEAKFALFIKNLDESKVMKKIRNLTDLAKGFKLSELRTDGREFIKCPRAMIAEIKQKDIPQYDTMVSELNSAFAKRSQKSEEKK
jgi:hypothetical protein